MKPENLTVEQWPLADLMSDVSEQCYAAGWMEGTEYHVWRLATEGGSWGMCDAEEIPKLGPILREAARLQCWIWWDEDRLSDGKSPVELVVWRQEYREWRLDERRVAVFGAAPVLPTEQIIDGPVYLGPVSALPGWERALGRPRGVDVSDPLGIDRRLAEFDDDEPCYVAGLVVPARVLRGPDRGPVQFAVPALLEQDEPEAPPGAPPGAPCPECGSLAVARSLTASPDAIPPETLVDDREWHCQTCGHRWPVEGAARMGRPYPGESLDQYVVRRVEDGEELLLTEGPISWGVGLPCGCYVSGQTEEFPSHRDLQERHACPKAQR